MAYINVYPSRINWENEPSIVSPINATNLNKMDYALYEIDQTMQGWDVSKANQSDMLASLKDVSYDTTTGVFVFTWWNGTTKTIDLNIEKIPASFSMDANGVITMTTDDGSTFTADVGSLIKTYTFADSSVIDFTVTTDAQGNKTVTADIVDGSITGNKLQPNYLADVQTAATNAANSATASASSSQDSEAWAVGTRAGVPVPSTDPAYENNAEYWANHTSASLVGLNDVNITNPQDKQALTYDAILGVWVNGEAAGGGLLPRFYIDSESGSTVTVITPDGDTITPTQISSGHWECDVPSYGVYTVHAVLNGDDATVTVTVDDVKEYHITDNHYSYTLSIYAPTGSTIRVSASGETYTGTGAGSTAVVFGLHQASTAYTITNTIDGVSKTDSVTTPSTTGDSGSRTFQWATINLTYDADFVGATINCVNGGTTISKTGTSGLTATFYIPTTGEWVISSTISGQTYSTSVTVSDYTSYSANLITIPDGSTVTPTDDIQTWLACAQITDKSYTTLAEVLADTETFTRLVSDSNACDYMARSTTWASDITSDADAMRLIGMYDYCSEVLLSNSTWMSAINNSGYFESVLDINVPTMTSNTTPSGEAFASNANNPAYYAFDNNESTYWWSNKTTYTNEYIGYKFPQPTIINRVNISRSSLVSGQTWKIQASNDNLTYDDLATFTLSSGDNTFIFANDSAYLYYRWYCVSGTASTSLTITTMNFYGRYEAQTGIIHSAVNDTVYYYANGVQTTLCVTDANGVGEVDYSTLPSGEITLYSSVAKDPDNLSADYSKTFIITENTTELYLMPDGLVMYWYGYMPSGLLEEAKTANGWNQWSSYPPTSPTFTKNTNYITVGKATSSNSAGGIGSVIAYDNSVYTNVRMIGDGVTTYDSKYGYFYIHTSKNYTQREVYLTASANVTLPLTSTSQYIILVTIGASSSRQIFNMKALWLE